MHVYVRQIQIRGLKAFGFTILAGALTLVPQARPRLLAEQGPPAGLPPQAAAQAEDQFEGELEVHYEDSNTGARLVHGLRIGNQRLEMIFEDDVPPGLEHGTRVRARGRRTGNTLALRSGGDVEVLGLASSTTFGEQRTLVMLVNFQDNTSAPENWASVHATTFQTVGDFYRENSYGQTWFTGDVAGYFTLPMNAGGSCDYNTIATLADQAAASAGYNVSGYKRKMYVFPRISCAWWGLGSVGGNPSRAWVNGTYALFVAAHEFGHNFGNHHSKSQPCDIGGCTTIEYGDDHDIMGNIAPVHTNAFQKERLGWLNYGGSPPIQTVTGSGAYTIDPMATVGAYPKALKILKSGSSAGSRTYYYVEARTPAGFDAGAGSGVLVHTGSESAANSSYQIDLAPASSGFDSLLDVGQTFTDSTIGLTIRTVSADAGGAVVEVSLGGGSTTPTCETAAPTVSLSPSGQQTTTPGASVSYTMSVRNNDTDGCATTTFTLAAAVPSGWSAGYDRASVNVAPGGIASALLTVTPSATASGTSSFTASVSRSGSAGPGGSTSGSILVSTPVSSLEVTASAWISKGTAKLTAIVRADGVALAGVPVTFRLTDPNGRVRTASATTTSSGVASSSMKLRPKDPKGTYQLQATATSGGVSGSGTTSFVN